MKKLILSSALLIIGLAGYSQTIIEFDFSKKAFTNANELEKLNLGDLYQIKITGIDMNLYQVGINKRDTITQTAITIPSFGSFPLDALDKLVSSLSQIGGIAAPGTSTDLNAFRNLDFVVQNYDITSSQKSSSNGQSQHLTLAQATAKDIDEKKALGFIQSQEGVIRSSYLTLVEEKHKVDNTKIEASKLLMKYQLINKSYTNLGSPTLNQIINNIDTERGTIQKIGTDLIKSNNQYNTNIDPLRIIIQDNKNLRKRDSLIRVTYSTFLKTVDSSLVSINATNTTALLNPIITYENNTGTEYLSFPMQFSKDQASLTLNITSRRTDNSLQPYSTSLIFPLEKKSFVGVSSGFYVSSLHNDSYSSKTVFASDTTYKLVKENSGKGEFGLNALVHYGLKINDKHYWNIAMGPGISISNKIRPRLFLGTGFAHGKKHKVIWNIGGTLGMVDRLSKAYNINNSYSEKPANTVVSKLSLGVYGSVGYIFIF